MADSNTPKKGAGSADSGRFDRAAWFYDWMYTPWERLVVRSLRDRLFAGIPAGRVLELGVGTGLNVPHYPESAEMTGVDISEKMLRRARRRAAASGSSVRLLVSDAGQLEFSDDEFDAAVGSFVFCSIADPVAGLRELARVVKPGGEIRLLEHVRINRPVIGRAMDLMDPLSATVGGFHVNRRTTEYVRLAGFEDVTEERHGPMGMIRLISAAAPRGGR